MTNKLYNFLKKFFLYFVIPIYVLYFFRANLYQYFISYQPIHQRPLIKIEAKMIKADLDFWLSTNEYSSVEQIIDFALWYATDEVHYTFRKCSTNPNTIFETKKTNCVGYSALFHAVVSYLLEKRGFAGQVKSEHKVAKLYFLGINLHHFFKDPAFKDHDFNVITDKSTHKKYMIDPTLSDNFGIRDVTERNEY
jgi:hypothetical protein